MACILYVKYNNTDFWARKFKNRNAAEAYWNRSKQIYKQKDGTLGTPIYVETGKGRDK